MIDDVRIVNYYRDSVENGQPVRQWRHEIQIQRDGQWIPVPVVEREDVGNLTVLPGELEEDADGC